MIQINSLLEYFLGNYTKFKSDDELAYYYQKQIDRCKKLLKCGIEYTTFEQFESLK